LVTRGLGQAQAAVRAVPASTVGAVCSHHALLTAACHPAPRDRVPPLLSRRCPAPAPAPRWEAARGGGPHCTRPAPLALWLFARGLWLNGPTLRAKRKAADICYTRRPRAVSCEPRGGSPPWLHLKTGACTSDRIWGITWHLDPGSGYDPGRCWVRSDI
jgi:hypothetical protein